MIYQQDDTPCQLDARTNSHTVSPPAAIGSGCLSVWVVGEILVCCLTYDPSPSSLLPSISLLVDGRGLTLHTVWAFVKSVGAEITGL